MSAKKCTRNHIWQEGKVSGFLTREFIQAENGSFKIVQIKPKAIYPDHRHPDKTEYASVLEGIVDFVLEEERHTCITGDFFVFPVNKTHAILNPGEETVLLLVGSIKK